MLNKFTQEQFEHILNVLILYNQLTPKETIVYLNGSLRLFPQIQLKFLV